MTFLYSVYHNVSKYTFGKSGIPRDRRLWPASWKQTQFKVYERFESYVLPPHREISTALTAAVTARKSTRVYTASLDETSISTILFHACAELDAAALEGRGRRVYASAGARYPTEIYVCLFKKVGELIPGVYHYGVRGHTLTKLPFSIVNEASIQKTFFYPETATATGVLVCTALFERTVIKYKERGYRQILLEVGAISHGVYLACAALGIGCVSMSGYDDVELEKILGIDGVTESVIHTVVIG